jgi:arylsulfatase A-like enzyme
VCTPTRYGILTGRYTWRSQLKRGLLQGYSDHLIEEDRMTVASLLKDNGYHTAYIGKWHLGWDWARSGEGKEDVDFTQPVSHGPNTNGFDYAYGHCGSLDMAPYVYVENGMPTAVPTKTTVRLCIIAGNRLKTSDSDDWPKLPPLLLLLTHAGRGTQPRVRRCAFNC